MNNTLYNFLGVKLQLGPNYDPLFYDVMIYIFGTVILVGILTLAIGLKIRKSKNKRKPDSEPLEK